jgi:hypothetical protein
MSHGETETRYRWEMGPDDALAVAHELRTLALDAGAETINVDDVIARVAPDAIQVVYEVPRRYEGQDAPPVDDSAFPHRNYG